LVSSIVHQYIQSTESIYSLLHKVLAVICVCQVRLEKVDVASILLDLCLRVLRILFFCWQVSNSNVCPFHGKQDCNSASDDGISPGNWRLLAASFPAAL
jgi:hypothetical protein